MSEKLNIADMTVSEVELVITNFEHVTTEMMAIIEEWMPVVMSQFSEQWFAATWLDKLHEVLSEMAPSIAKAAGLLGQIPVWDDNAPENVDGYQLIWKPYP